MSILSKSASYAGMAIRFVFNIVLPFALGIFFNWVFTLVFLVKWAGSITLSNSIVAVILAVLFLVGFPFLYFWLARAFALRQGLVKLYDGSHDLIEKLVGIIVRTTVKTSSATGLQSAMYGNSIKDKKGFIRKIDEKLPAPIRWILSFFMSQVPIYGALAEVGEKMELKPENLEQIQPAVQEKVDIIVKERLVGDSYLWFWGLVVVNIVIMAATWWFYN